MTLTTRKGAVSHMFDIAQAFDAIDAAFGVRRDYHGYDYLLHVGDIVTCGDVTYTVRDCDFADLPYATATELAVTLGAHSVDTWISGNRVYPTFEIVPCRQAQRST